MSDWQVGDLALCVNVSNIPGKYRGVAGRRFTLGAVYTVEGISSVTAKGSRGCFLIFAEPFGMASSVRFRKIRPDEHEACEPEFVQLMKRCTRKVSA